VSWLLGEMTRVSHAPGHPKTLLQQLVFGLGDAIPVRVRGMAIGRSPFRYCRAQRTVAAAVPKKPSRIITCRVPRLMASFRAATDASVGSLARQLQQ